MFPWHEARAFSSAVKSPSARPCSWPGMSPVDIARKLVGPAAFDAQVQQVWENMPVAVEKAVDSLADIVSMTVFLTDRRFGNRFIELREQKFGRDFLASVLIGINQLAVPGMLIEIQATIGDVYLLLGGRPIRMSVGI